MSHVSELKSFESACYCDLVHTTCTYCDAVAMDKMITKRMYGKKLKRPYNMPQAQRRSVYVDGETWEALKKIGNGNASEGIRQAVRNKN